MQLVAAAPMALAVAGILVAIVHPLFAPKHTPSVVRYVSLIKHGQLQVCRITPRRVICPPLSSSPSKSYSTSTSLSPSVHTQ